MYELDRRAFVRMTGLGTASLAFSPLAFAQEQIPIAELTINQMAGFSVRGLLQAYQNAIVLATDPPTLPINAFMEVGDELEPIVAELDMERRAGRVRGPLHGIPIVVKDNIDTADGMSTSAGSLALAESVAARDAHLVRRLREAGAVIMAKTNLSEWANFRSTHSTSGWSARGGLTRNPYAPDRNCCGSSSGTAAAVAANLAAAGIGTETDGSIVCPSAVCGIVGLKPTVGLISRSGIIPIAQSQDTAGPMARTVRDAAILLNGMVGIDSLDPITLTSRGHVPPDYTAFLDPDGLRGARIGVARQFFDINDHVTKVMNEALDVLKRLGATLVDPADMETATQYFDSELEVLLYEFKAGINAYLAQLGPKVKTRTLADLIRFNEENREKEMPFFGQELFERAQTKGPLTSPEYVKALARNRRLSRAEGIDAVIAKHKLDAIIAPTTGPAWTTDLVNGDHYTGGCSTAAAVAGYPHITVPAGFAEGLPVGLSFFADAWSEPRLLRFAYAFEQATKARRAPK